MRKVQAGRFTAKIDGPFVVFVIGMRINKLYRFDKWLPVFFAMPPMLKTLMENPQKGFLGGENLIYWRGPALLQYWRSFEDLEKFASEPEDPHRAAWQRFNKAVGTDGTVGIFHETYKVEPGAYECVYNNMPAFGLASATEHVPVTSTLERARTRIERLRAPN
jgi:hypothetical protein